MNTKGQMLPIQQTGELWEYKARGLTPFKYITEDDAIAYAKRYAAQEVLRERELCAAMPDLISALNAMLNHMGMDEDEYNKPAFDKARAAIAKATGDA